MLFEQKRHQEFIDTVRFPPISVERSVHVIRTVSVVFDFGWRALRISRCCRYTGSLSWTVGEPIDVKDVTGAVAWRPSLVVNATEEQVKVHYMGLRLCCTSDLSSKHHFWSPLMIDVDVCT